MSALVGAWLMAAPTLLGLAGAAADSAHIMGALVVTFSVIAFAEPSRLVRWLNVLCGLWVLVTPWILGGGTPAWRWISVAGGLALIALSLRCGPVEDRMVDGNDLSLEGAMSPNRGHHGGQLLKSSRA